MCEKYEEICEKCVRICGKYEEICEKDEEICGKSSNFHIFSIWRNMWEYVENMKKYVKIWRNIWKIRENL